MDTARKAFDNLWDSMHEPLQNESSSAEQPAPKPTTNETCPTVEYESAFLAPTTACPNVASLLESVSTESLDWLVENFLWGHVSKYVLSCDGTLAYFDDHGRVSADVKLELLIKLTRERREHFCTNPDMDILTEDQLKIVLNDWKNDFGQWMHPQTLQLSHSSTPQQWHQTLRKSFRSFLFHLIGCYEMSIFFLVAPFTPDTLDLFQSSWTQSATNEKALAFSKRLVRDSSPVPSKPLAWDPSPVLLSLADEPSDSISSKPHWTGQSRRY
jgi:hypothetical protein